MPNCKSAALDAEKWLRGTNCTVSLQTALTCDFRRKNETTVTSLLKRRSRRAAVLSQGWKRQLVGASLSRDRGLLAEGFADPQLLHEDHDNDGKRRCEDDA